MRDEKRAKLVPNEQDVPGPVGAYSRGPFGCLGCWPWVGTLIAFVALTAIAVG